MKKRLFIKLLSVLLILTVWFGTAATGAAAAGESGDGYSLCIEYVDEGKVIPDAVFHIYRIADELAPSGIFPLTDEYADCDVVLENNMTNAELMEKLEVLTNAVKDKGLKPVTSGKTDSEGKLEVTGLAAGLYMVTGDDLQVGSLLYRPQAFCVVLPKYEDGMEVGQDSVTPKYEVVNISTPTPAPTSTPAPTPLSTQDAPRTGDEAHLLLWFAMATVFVTGIVVAYPIIPAVKRRRNEGDKTQK